jgi:hypothetical protein
MPPATFTTLTAPEASHAGSMSNPTSTRLVEAISIWSATAQLTGSTIVPLFGYRSGYQVQWTGRFRAAIMKD